MDGKPSLVFRIRACVNAISRKMLKSEALRKLMVVKYYSICVKTQNLKRKKACPTADELLSWRSTMKVKVEYSNEVYRGNVFYGVGSALKEYCSECKPIAACIEHGLYFADYVNESEMESSELPALVTFGEERYKAIRRRSIVPVCEIGPYIAYAEPYLDNYEYAKAKQKLGKTLLVFPSHSIETAERRFCVDEFISEIDALREKGSFDTVLVSLYYRDIINGDAFAYEKAGFVVVTSGYREDSNFMRRQRSLINLADYTCSNTVGTHIGYCVYLGKRHLLIESAERSCYSGVPLRERRMVGFGETSDNQNREIWSAFSAVTGEITKEQQRICEKYWGLSKVKTREEIKYLFKILEKAAKAKPKMRQDNLRRLLIDSNGGSKFCDLIHIDGGSVDA